MKPNCKNLILKHMKKPILNTDHTSTDNDADKTGTDSNADCTENKESKNRFEKPEREINPDTTGIDTDADKTQPENTNL